VNGYSLEVMEHMAKSRIDLHPNYHYFNVVEAVAGTYAKEELELGVPGSIIPGGKILAIEILSITCHCSIAAAPIANGRTDGMFRDSEANDIIKHRVETALTTNGAVVSAPVQYDLTDGDGHGIIMAKNPTVGVQSSAMGAVQSFTGSILWRYKEVKATEFLTI